jgi:hypothetical protein
MPRRVREFYDLERNAVDILIDAVKYIASTAGVALAIYMHLFEKYTESGLSAGHLARLIVFLPVLLWLATIVTGVLGILPRTFKAATDQQKEQAVLRVRRQKRFWVLLSTCLFVSGFALAVYLFAAQLWAIYPFANAG